MRRKPLVIKPSRRNLNASEGISYMRCQTVFHFHARAGWGRPHAIRMTGQRAHSIAIVEIQWSAFLRLNTNNNELGLFRQNEQEQLNRLC